MTDTQTGELAFSVDLPHPPEKVWRALTIRAFFERRLLKPASRNDERLEPRGGLALVLRQAQDEGY